MLFSVGCAQKYAFKTGLPESDKTITEWQHQGFYGYASDNRFDLDKACPEGVSEFGSYISLLNWFPALVTIGLYTPRTAYAVCAQGGSS